MRMARLAFSALIGMIVGLVIGGGDATLLFINSEMFFDGPELLRTATWAVGICLGAGVIWSVTADAVLARSSRLFARRGWLGRTRPTATAVAALVAVPVCLLFYRLTQGPQARLMPGRMAIVVAASVISAAVIGLAAAVVPPWVSKRAQRKVAAAALSILAMAGLTLVDATVLVRLYPAFHQGLTALAFIVGWLGLHWSIPRPQGKRAIRALLVLGLLTVAFLGYASVRVLGAQNARFVIDEKAVAVSDLVALARFIAPPPPERRLDADVRHVAAASAVSSGPALLLPGADLFLITVDAMRYDRLSRLGAKRKVAPNIDHLADTSVLFSRAYSPMPHTSYAITSLLTGKYTKPLFDVPGAPAVHETWPEILHRFRYESSAFFTPSIFFIDSERFLPYLRKGAGFSYRKADSGITAEERVDRLIAHLDSRQASGHPHFSWVHFFEPHEPYEPHCPALGDTPMDRYDCEILGVDKALGKLFDYLRTHRPRAIIIVTADHGEEFGDHGGRYHGSSLYDEQIRVPLLMHLPDVAPRIVREPVSLVDLLGTCLVILDIPVPARVRSRDISPLIAGRDLKTDAFSQTDHQAMVVFDGHKIVCDTKSHLCQLYDLNADPLERRSIAEQQPALLEEMKRRLFGWIGGHAGYELRPIITKSGAHGWPEVIKQALSGDANALAALPALIATSDEPRIRRKAAELVFQMAISPLPANADQRDEKDDVVAAWLLAHRIRQGAKEEVALLAERAPRLAPGTPVARTAALTRLGAGDRQAFEEVLVIALDKTVSMEERSAAVRLLSESKDRSLVKPLVSLINIYQLTLDVINALARLKARTALKDMVVRLKRERFPERKTAIITALAEIGDPRAVGAIAAELFGETPPTGAIAGLLAFTRPSVRGQRLPLKEKERVAMLYRPIPKASVKVPVETVIRVVLRTKSEAEGGGVQVSCNGEDKGRIPLLIGETEGFLDIKGCARQDKRMIELSFKLPAGSPDADLIAAVVLGMSAR